VTNRKKIKTGCLSLLILSIIALCIIFSVATKINPPVPDDLSVMKMQRMHPDSNFYTCGKCWLKKNQYGLWEMYLEGNAFERGCINGILTKELIHKQEKAFIQQIDLLVPSRLYLRFLNLFVAWFNRNLDKYISNEYLLEIYGISMSASDEFRFIGSPYQRMLNYHAAHDIGHALQDYHFVACTSFSAWGSKTQDSTPIIGRNFDFYVGDNFAEDKIVCYVKTDKGYKFMMISWGVMIGAVSGMNEKGLTITMNAGKSDIPLHAATPISIIAREILQYAKNIKEAFDIAKKYHSFVSESLMIGSLEDNKTAIIEKTPLTTALFYSDTNFIICSNHFQSTELKNNLMNLGNIKESSSMYRYQRMLELISENPIISPPVTAEILRNRNGLKNKDIGMGNEKSINQLIAHHSVIFKPSQKLVWVSANPYQLGKYIAYDFNRVFENEKKTDTMITIPGLHLPADTFLLSPAYQKYLQYNKYKHLLLFMLRNISYASIRDKVFTDFISTNPENYLPYMLAGEYFQKKKDYSKAAFYYKQALTKEIATNTEKNNILKNINYCIKKLNNK